MMPTACHKNLPKGSLCLLRLLFSIKSYLTTGQRQVNSISTAKKGAKYLLLCLCTYYNEVTFLALQICFCLKVFQLNLLLENFSLQTGVALFVDTQMSCNYFGQGSILSSLGCYSTSLLKANPLSTRLQKSFP